MSKSILRYAAIDIGTNSVLLLVVEVNKSQQIKVLTEQRYSLRTEGDAKTKGEINNQTKNLLFDILDNYQTVIKSFQIDQISVSATQRFRIASNGTEIINEIKERYSWQAEIISGKNEAELSFTSASTGINGIKDQQLVIDVGGGSTEIILGSKRKIVYSDSFPIGAVNLSEQMDLTGITSDSQIEETLVILEQILIKAEIPEIPTIFSTLVVGGTASTLAAISLNMKKFDPDLIHGVKLSLDWIEAEIKNLANKNLRQRKELIPFDPDRADIILAGTIILYWIIRKMEIDSIICSNRGLRWGLLYDRFLLKK